MEADSEQVSKTLAALRARSSNTLARLHAANPRMFHVLHGNS
jgi:hypothetical protein